MDRRTFLLSVVLLPLVQFQPMQYGGSQAYNCEIAESAFARWYISAASPVWVDWLYYDHAKGKADFGRKIAYFDVEQRFSSWFVSSGYHEVRSVYWSAAVPIIFIDGSCIVIVNKDPESPNTDNPIPADIQALVDAGWGVVSFADTGENGPTIGFHSLPVAGMERMGYEERVRLGIEADYQFILAHRPPPPTA